MEVSPQISRASVVLFMCKQRQLLSLQQKNNANTLSETSGLLKSEVDMLRETWEAFKTEDMVVHFI